MEKTISKSRISSPEGRPVRERRWLVGSTRKVRVRPCGRKCCGSYMRSSLDGLLLNSPSWISESSAAGQRNYNSMVTGLPGELLIADTGCPSNAPAGLSSADWASLGWPYGITYTLNATEWKKGANHPRSIGSLLTLGHVPTVCQAAFLQGLPPDHLHLWGREMLSRFRSPAGLQKKLSRLNHA